MAVGHDVSGERLCTKEPQPLFHLPSRVEGVQPHILLKATNDGPLGRSQASHHADIQFGTTRGKLLACFIQYGGADRPAAQIIRTSPKEVEDVTIEGDRDGVL